MSDEDKSLIEMEEAVRAGSRDRLKSDLEIRVERLEGAVEALQRDVGRLQELAMNPPALLGLLR